MERLWKDIKFGLRTFVRTPTFTAAAALSLGLGIGLNSTIFTLVNTLFLNPLPVDRPADLVAVFTVDAKTVRQLSVPPDPFVVDEAFRRIYSEERIDFKNVRKQELASLLKAIKQDVNARMQANIIQDVLIEDFNYISKDDLRK